MRISFLSNWIKRWRIWYYKRLDAFDVYDDSQPIGKRGERYAARFLQMKGYQIVRTNWKNGQYELDIVALDGDVLVFVEVKTRSDETYYPPEKNVNLEKQRRIRAAAESFKKLYLPGLGLNKCRIDVIAIVWRHGTRRPETVRHWENCVETHLPLPSKNRKSRNKDDEFTVRF